MTNQDLADEMDDLSQKGEGKFNVEMIQESDDRIIYNLSGNGNNDDGEVTAEEFLSKSEADQNLVIDLLINKAIGGKRPC